MYQLYGCIRNFVIVLSIVFFSNSTIAQPVLSFTERITGLAAPIDLAHPGDGSGRIFIVQKGGAIRLYDSNFNFIKVFTTFTSIIRPDGEGGLLSMAFHPDYESNRHFFVYYSNTSGHIEIARYSTMATDSNTVEAGSGQLILTILRNPGRSNHYGGDLNFGPDGNLWVGVGDGGGSNDPDNTGQDPNTLLGKMIRINVDDFVTPPYYTIPADNPYAASADTLKEIWAFGLRNPWRWSFDRQTGDMWLSDVGQGAWEEVNFVEAGATGGLNFGWDCFEGNHPSSFPCAISGSHYIPIFEYTHNAAGGISITGGYVYRGFQYPLIYGYYITADYQSQRAWLVSPDGAGGFDSSSQSIAPVDAVVSFGEVENGELFLLSQSSNSVFQVSSISTVPVTMTSFTGLFRNGRVDLHWEVSTESNVQEYRVEYSTNGTAFSTVGSITAANARAYAFTHPVSGNDDYYYRLKIVDLDDSYEYSKLVYIKNPAADETKKLFVVPTVINNRMINVHLDKQYNVLQVISLEGKEVWKENITGRSGIIRLQLPDLRQGHYIVRLVSDSGIRTQRIIIGN